MIKQYKKELFLWSINMLLFRTFLKKKMKFLPTDNVSEDRAQ